MYLYTRTRENYVFASQGFSIEQNFMLALLCLLLGRIQIYFQLKNFCNYSRKREILSLSYLTLLYIYIIKYKINLYLRENFWTAAITQKQKKNTKNDKQYKKKKIYKSENKCKNV